MRANLFTEDSPIQSVEEYTEWWLEKKGQYDMLQVVMETRELEHKLFNPRVKEIPLHKAKHISYDLISSLDEHIDNTYYPWLVEDSFYEADLINEFLADTEEGLELV